MAKAIWENERDLHVGFSKRRSFSRRCRKRTYVVVTADVRLGCV